MTKDEALKMAMEALEHSHAREPIWKTPIKEAITALRQAIAEAEKQKPLAWMDREGDVYKKEPPENWCPPHTPLYPHPQPKAEQEPVALTEQQAHDMGAKGGEPTEAERLLFEAWMRGHCWAVIGEWDGKTYVHEHEANGFVNTSAMHTRRLWAAWRDRAALEATHPQPKGEPLTDEQIDDIWNRYCDEMGEASINDAYSIARAIEAAHGIKEKNK